MRSGVDLVNRVLSGPCATPNTPDAGYKLFSPSTERLWRLSKSGPNISMALTGPVHSALDLASSHGPQKSEDEMRKVLALQSLAAENEHNQVLLSTLSWRDCNSTVSIACGDGDD